MVNGNPVTVNVHCAMATAVYGLRAGAVRVTTAGAVHGGVPGGGGPGAVPVPGHVPVPGPVPVPGHVPVPGPVPVPVPALTDCTGLD